MFVLSRNLTEETHWEGCLMFSRLRTLFSQPKTPSYRILELEKPIPVTDHADDAAIASLAGHPGMTALLNRLKLRRAVLEKQLQTKQFKDLTDVYSLQLGILGSRNFEYEIREATKNLEVKRERPATFDEIQQFDRAMNSIESLRPTNVG